MKMKLKRFEQAPQSSKKNKSHNIRIHSVGSVVMNMRLSERLGLSPGTGMSFHQDETEKKDGYLSIDKDSANKVRLKTGTTTYLFNNVRLAEEILESVYPGKGVASVCFPVSAIPIEVEGIEGPVYAIITSVRLPDDED